MRAKRGRPTSTRIHNNMDEVEENAEKRCGFCRQVGHTRRTCPVVVASATGTGASSSGAGTSGASGGRDKHTEQMGKAGEIKYAGDTDGLDQQLIMVSVEDRVRKLEDRVAAIELKNKPNLGCWQCLDPLRTHQLRSMPSHHLASHSREAQ
ncbi:hypothetical protein PIB30_053844 [Stylosanthes scabra]|uniref:CCHC-type domain-containing protein n=1 Tax=Stylosanthes scabra TaxID=79078 RepID=A0ABU6VHJ1_9FABA|nr:hypothetical protein [Stylosanthes scabra]